MLRVAIQVKELISTNVTSALDSMSSSAKTLHKLQREIEEAIITLEGERTKTDRKLNRSKATLTQMELREADWTDKAKTAMDHGREDLARQALLAREDGRLTIATTKEEVAQAEDDLKEINSAIKELEVKREETRERAKAQLAADAENCGSPVPGASSAERHLDRISQMERRVDFATEDSAEARSNAGVDREIEELRRASNIDAELATMRKPAAKSPAKRGGKKAK